MSSYFDGGIVVTHEQVLDARERRAARQQALMEQHRGSLLCLTLNIPGAVKRYPLADRGFRAGRSAVDRQLSRLTFPVLYREIHEAATGMEAYYCVDADAAALKSAAMEIERHHPLGRLFDLDVFDRTAEKIDGAALGRPARECLLCGGPVWECARSRRHDADALAERAAQILSDYFSDVFAAQIAALAEKALLYELAVTPKPGLVDRANSGAHRDMDYFLLTDSAVSLTEYFKRITVLGTGIADPAAGVPDGARWLGQVAEDDMFAATGAVNTHKGAIFSLGLLCLAAGVLYQTGAESSIDTLTRTAAALAAPTVAAFPGTPATHGELVHARSALTGARGEAAGGFATARAFGLPTLRNALAAGYGINDAGVLALMALIANTADTNLVYRGGLEAAQAVQAGVRQRLENRSFAEQLTYAAQLDAELISKNLSPGGCADLLAVTFFLHGYGSLPPPGCGE